VVTIFWYIMPCSSLKVQHRFSTCHLLSHWFLTSPPSVLHLPHAFTPVSYLVYCLAQNLEAIDYMRLHPRSALHHSFMLIGVVKLHDEPCLHMSHTAQDALCWRVLDYPSCNLRMPLFDFTHTNSVIIV
jgi:hypothetical protein